MEVSLQRWLRSGVELGRLLAAEEEGEGGLASSAQHHRDAPTSSFGQVSEGKEQCAVVVERGWLARHSTIEEMVNGPTSSLGQASMGKEQCAVVVSSLKLGLGGGGGVG